MEPKYNLIKEHPWHGNPELSGLLLMGCANEHHEWPTPKITHKPWGSGAINFCKCFSFGCGYLTLDAAQSYIHVFCEPPTAEIKIRHGYFWVWGNCTYDLENWNWGKYHKILKRGTGMLWPHLLMCEGENHGENQGFRGGIYHGTMEAAH